MASLTASLAVRPVLPIVRSKRTARLRRSAAKGSTRTTSRSAPRDRTDVISVAGRPSPASPAHKLRIGQPQIHALGSEPGILEIISNRLLDPD
jgi:hypothetical protein